GVGSVPSRPVELLIALTVLALAVELGRPAATFARRFPWAMALAFGLLHGLGFAGALREVGLPAGAGPLALFSLHARLEAGRLRPPRGPRPAAGLGRSRPGLHDRLARGLLVLRARGGALLVSAVHVRLAATLFFLVPVGATAIDAPPPWRRTENREPCAARAT